jgi:RimJ/RimL family protein N-acetyltransferase
MTTTRPVHDSLAEPAAGRLVSYRLQVAGHLDDHWSDRFGGHPLVRNSDTTTTLTVDVVDQTQLHGILTGIRDLGVTLESLHVADDARAEQTPTMPVLTHPLRTERLTLRAATPHDAEATWAYRRLDSVNEWLTGVPATFHEYRMLFGEPARLSTTVLVELDHQGSHVVVGDFMLRRGDAWSQAEVTDQANGAQAELGWVLDPSRTGAGYATEAARELLRYCFEELGTHRVVASCFLDNDSSWRLMGRLGMRRETHAVRESLHRSGQWLDTVTYALLTEEWHRRA